MLWGVFSQARQARNTLLFEVMTLVQYTDSNLRSQFMGVVFVQAFVVASPLF